MATTAAGLLLPHGAFAAAAEDFPPGWLPINNLTNDTPWAKTDDRIRLYLPNGDKPVRGVFACFVFHSQDPRELADLWNFALVTVPWPFEYDLGINDKRNGRYQAGHPMQNMGLLLRYTKLAIGWAIGIAAECVWIAWAQERGDMLSLQTISVIYIGVAAFYWRQWVKSGAQRAESTVNRT